MTTLSSSSASALSAPLPILNIVHLIEKNPIMRFQNNTYQNKLIQKIQQNFTESHQQLFIGSFYCYLNYTKTDFVIDLDNIWKWLGFTRKDHCKRLLEKYFIINIDYIVSAPPIGGAFFSDNKVEKAAPPIGGAAFSEDKINKGGAGINKERVLLSVNTFKKLCIKSNTKKADEIHDYFIKLEETIQEVINEESYELQLQLLQSKEQIQRHEKHEKQQVCAFDKLQQSKVLEKHNMLLREFANKGSIVYVVKIKTFHDGKYIIKIGESRRGIEQRYNEHKSHYDECMILDCYSVTHSKDFESFLHHTPIIQNNKVTNLSGHETENELFLIGTDLTYGMVTNIINTHIRQFNSPYGIEDIENIIIKCLSNQSIHPPSNNDLAEIVIQNKILLTKMQGLETKIQGLEKTIQELKYSVDKSQSKITTGFGETHPNIGPRVQKIHPDTLQLVNVYESASDCMKENSNIKRPSLSKAILENTIYCGFRWANVDREMNPNIISIEPTKITRQQNLDYVAKLNQEKTHIVALYLDRKTASIKNKYPTDASLDTVVKKGTLSNGYYYVLYENCSDDMRQIFEQKIGSKPVLYKDGIGKYDINNRLVQEYTSKYNCTKMDIISEKTLKKALNENKPYCGYYYKRIVDKLYLGNA